MILALPIDHFSGEVNPCGGPSNAHHFLQPPEFLGIQITEQGHDQLVLTSLCMNRFLNFDKQKAGIKKKKS